MEASDITQTPEDQEANVTPADTPAATSPETTTDDLIRQVLQQQQEHRAEVAALREEVNRQRQSPVTGPPPSVRSESELRQARLDELNNADYYCPACGATSSYPKECTGKTEAPHPPVEVVPTDEVRNAPDPDKDPDAYREWQKGHTPAPVST